MSCVAVRWKTRGKSGKLIHHLIPKFAIRYTYASPLGPGMRYVIGACQLFSISLLPSVSLHYLNPKNDELKDSPKLKFKIPTERAAQGD
jgi:hypothetical protein